MAKQNQPHYGHKAFRLLQTAFVLVPIIAGLDKFFDLLTRWGMYLAPQVITITGMPVQSIMMIAGVIEIIAGIGVLFKPKFFSYVVSLWLLLIIVNLLVKGAFYDIALRDFGLLLGALALGKLSHKYS